VPGDLRRRVLEALHFEEPSPVRVAEIRAALAATGADAMIYLVPGHAVVVPVTGEVETLALPTLTADRASLVGRYAQAGGGGRDAGPIDDRPPGPELAQLCDWAWGAAVGPLLDYAGRWRLRRPPQLVLVAMGVLAAVPWHAASYRDSSGLHYAVEHAVFSYTVSARTLCDGAKFPARAVRSTLVVGDPEGNLPYAGLEAQAISRAFYPHGSYLGSPAGTGTPQQVLDWIAETAPGPSLLHLACHGRADPEHPTETHLRLAGGTLTARRLLDASRTAELEIERVFLAACTTGMTGTDYDEAFSLSTAFLAAGARTVFGSLWPVPDAETSLLMFLVHYHLNTGECSPADALHRAQLWMLDPGRLAPPGLPPELVGHSTGATAADPLSWAAFTHQGR
jgi:hypothetical protein